MGKRWPKPRLPAPNKPESKGPPLRRRVPTPQTDENVSLLPPAQVGVERWADRHKHAGVWFVREASSPATPALDVVIREAAQAVSDALSSGYYLLSDRAIEDQLQGKTLPSHHLKRVLWSARLAHPDSDGDAR